MFGIGTSELVVIAVIIFLIYGPDKLPAMLRKATQFYKDIRQASEDVSGVIRREVRNFEIMTRYPNESTPSQETPALSDNPAPDEEKKKEDA